MDSYSHIQITMEEGTWIASISVLGEISATLICGYLADVFGRIRMFQLALIFTTMGYATITASTNVNMIITGRFLEGLAIGAYYPGIIYVSEISPPKYRGLFLSISPLFTSIGTCVMYAIMSWQSWIVASGILCLMSFLSLLPTFLYRDSPQSLVQRGKIKEARRSLKRFEVPESLDAKMKELQERVEESRKNEGSLFTKGFGTFLEPAVWKPLLMMITLSFLQSGSGVYIVGFFYTINFLEEFQVTFNPQIILISLAVMRLLSSILSSYLQCRSGRRTLGAVSGFSSALLLSVTLGYLLWRPKYPAAAETFDCIPSVCLLLFSTFTAGLGIFPLPWFMPNEVFPLKIRGVMCGVCFFFMNIFMFITTKMYNVMMDVLGLHGTLLLFIICSLLFGVVSLVFLVETHEKTLDEIEEEFSGIKREAKQEKS